MYTGPAMERPPDKWHRSPPVHDYRQHSPYLPPLPSVPPGARPRSPHGPRHLSPSSARPRSPFGPAAHSRPRSPFVPRPRSPYDGRPRSPGLPRSRSPRDSRPLSPYGARPRSPFESRPRYEGSRPRSPHAHRGYSPHGARLRSPRSPFHAPRHHSPPGPMSRAPRHPSPPRGPWRSPDSRRRAPYPEAPSSEDLLDHLMRRHRKHSPHSLSEKAFVEKSLKITVGNDLFNRHSLEKTKLYDALDNVSDDSREDFVDECILPRDFSLASLRSRSDEKRRSPWNIKNDVDYRRDGSAHPDIRIGQDAHLRSHQENATMPRMSSQHEHFTAMKNTHDRFNQFSFTADAFLKDFPKNNTSGTGYQNLERPTEQDLYVLLSEGILADKRKRCKDFGQWDTLLQKQDSSVGKADYPGDGRMSHYRNTMNRSGAQEGYPATHLSDYVPQKEVDGIVKTDAASPSYALASTQEQSNLEHSEFGKIQDLLKTIGLDMGAAEMGKLSVRTKERLYGKNLPTKVRERHSTDSQIQDAANLRNRSYTRSPELNQKFSLSPACSVRTSTDRLSHSKSEFSVKEKDDAQELPGSPAGQEPSSPAVACKPDKLSSRQDPLNNTPGQEFQIAVLGMPPPSNYTDLPSPAVLTPTLLAPDNKTNIAPYTSAHMLQGSVNMASPRPPFPPPFPPAFPPFPPMLPPPFVPNTSIPPPMLFPPYPLPSFPPYSAAYMTHNFGIPTATTPFRSNIYASFARSTNSKFPASPVAPYKKLKPLRSNLKVIANSNIDTFVQPNKSASSHLVHAPIKNTSEQDKTPLDDKNRVAQKLKVLRDLHKLKNDQSVRGKKLALYQKNLETLNARHGEVLQNKVENNYSFVNPLLQQAKRIENELLKLCKESEEADKLKSSLEKVGKILGLNISEKPNPSAENENKPTEDDLKVDTSPEKSTNPIEVKTQTQVGNSTSS